MLRKLFKETGDEHEFKPILAEIETQPLNPLGRFIFWLLIGVIVFFSIWLYVGKVDIVISARGKIIPDGEIKIVQTLDTGVLSKINFRPGDYVKKGEVLVEIDPSTTNPAFEAATKNMNHLTIETERISALLSGKPFVADSGKYDSELIALQAEIYKSTKEAFSKLISAKKSELSKIDEQYSSLLSEKEKNESLLKYSNKRLIRLESVKDIVSTETYENEKKEVLNYEKALEAIQFKLNEVALLKKQTLSEIAYQEDNFRETNLKELSEKKRQVSEIEAEMAQLGFMKRKQSIEAPINGYINELYINTIGGVVTTAQKLLSIVPDKTELIVEALVLNKDVGFLEKDMPVSIKIDTFNFQKYGMIDGTVIQVSKDSIVDEQLGPVYKMYVKPEQTSLMVEGRKNEITSGMTLTSEVNVGKRRIIEFFVYPLIKYLDEGMSVR